jgi:hypothetical protein
MQVRGHNINWTLIILVCIAIALAAYRPDILHTLTHSIVTIGGVLPSFLH